MGNIGDTTGNTVPNTVLKNKRIWNPLFIAILGALLVFTLGSVMYVMNWNRLGRKKERNVSIIVLIIIHVGLFNTAYLTMSDEALFMIEFFVKGGVGLVFFVSQNKLYKEHINNSGRKGKILLPILIGIVLFIGMSSMEFFSKMPQDEKTMSQEKIVIHYSQDVDEGKVEKLMERLQTRFYESNMDVTLEKEDDVYVVGFFTRGFGELDENQLKFFKAFGVKIKLFVFEGENVRIKLMSVMGNVRETIDVN